jgi:release factor glutamine methyltransferase
VSESELAAFKPLLRRRAAREPLHYIVGRAAFRELELEVDRRALIPRPETEGLVDVVLDWARRRASTSETGDRLSAADIGTGSGCIALSLAREGPFGRVVATDASPDALALAARNASKHALEAVVELRGGDLLAPLGGERFDALVSNPPYIAEPERDALEPEVRDFEPPLALYGGPDGLVAIRALVNGAAEHLLPGGLLALEVGAEQSRAVAALVDGTGAFEATRAHRDLSGRSRVVSATLVGR